MSYIEMESPVKKEKKVAAHPKVSVMVETAIKTLAEPKGSSLKAINKYIEAHYIVDAKKLSTFIKRYLKAAVERGDLLQPKGKGVSGSFKINKKKPEPKPKVHKAKSPKNLKMQTSTPNKVSKPKKAATKSPNKSPVKKLKLTDEVVSADATFSKPKTKTAKKPKVSLPTKPRKSLVSMPTKVKKPKASLPTKPRKSLVSIPAKVKKPKKLMTKNVKAPKVSASPGRKSDNSVTSPKPTKIKAATKTTTTKAKKSPKPGKNLIPKKAVAKKAPANDGQK